MQPQQPTPSEQPAADASAAPPPSEPTEGTPDTSWQARLLGRLGRIPRGPESSQAAEEASQPAATSNTLTLTQEELDRRVQAETDRREAKRREQAAVERRRQLRDSDPWAYAEEDRSAEQAMQVNSQTADLFGRLGAEHDKYTLDPLVELLPEAERKRILSIEGAGVGLDGRKLIATEGLKALEKHWKAEGARDAESKLRRNPAFRKQVLAEMRGKTPEPEYLPSGSGSEADKTVSDLLRGRIGRHNTL